MCSFFVVRFIKTMLLLELNTTKVLHQMKVVTDVSFSV